LETLQDGLRGTNVSWKKEVMPAIKERLQDFNSRGITPTLRAMFYALVSRGVIPNSQEKYQYLSHFTARAREGGELPMNCFADQSRRIIQDFSDVYQLPEQYIELGIEHLRNAAHAYHNTIPRWHNQPEYVEVWIEKEALSGTFKSILKNRQVKIVPNRGFSSIGFSYDNIQRLKRFQDKGKNIHILYFGDLDPSGEVIDEVISKKLIQYGIFEVDFRRIAVTEEQTRHFNLPHNPDPETFTKLKKDTRAQSFMSRHNGELFQIEVDALQAYAPEEFKNLIQKSVDKYFDWDIYNRVLSDPRHSEKEINSSQETGKLTCKESKIGGLFFLVNIFQIRAILLIISALTFLL
jgi:hypothetical protein